MQPAMKQQPYYEFSEVIQSIIEGKVIRLSTSENFFYCFCFDSRNNLVFQFYIAKSSFRKRKEAVLKKGVFC